jgi:hypothetical protein
MASSLLAMTIAACGGDSDPTPQADPLVQQVDALFPAGTSRDEARTLAGSVTTAADGGDPATAQARAFDLAELTATEFYAGRLAPAAAQQPAAIDKLLTDAFDTAGLPDPGLEPANFNDEGLVAVVRGAGGTFVAATQRAGIDVPAGAVPRTALLAFRRLPDSSRYAPRAGPLPTALDQYPLFYEFDFTPEIELTADAIIGLCQFADPASAYYPLDAIFARLQLAHPDPADRSVIALLEPADAPFLDCDGTSASVRKADAGRASLAQRRIGIGGRVRKFSPFAAVDPEAAPTTATLTVSRNGTGTGTIGSSPAGITCGADCSEPYAAGTSVTLTATPASGSAFAGWSGGGCSGTGSCTLAVAVATTVTATFNTTTTGVTITTTTLPGGTVNAAYSATLAATGGTGTYTWSVVTGTLPAGVALNATTGVVSGTPTAAGTSNFTVQAASGGQTAQRALSIVIATSGSLADFDFGGNYPGVITFSGGTSVNWTVFLNSQAIELPIGTPYSWTRTATSATTYNVTFVNQLCGGTLTGQLTVTSSVPNPFAPPPLRAQTFTISNLAGNDCGTVRSGGTGNFIAN